MSHLGDERLLELGLDLEAALSAGEAAHLAECPSCAEALESERALTRSLATAMPRALPSADFVAATTARFVATRRPVAPRRGFAAIGLGLAAVVLLLVPSVWVIVTHAGDITRYLAIGAKDLTVLLSAVSVVAEKVPLGPVMVAAVTATVLLGVSLGLGRLAAEAGRQPLPVTVRA